MTVTPTPRTRGSKGVALRRSILQRDGYRCVMCRAKGKLTIAAIVNHIVPLIHGGTDAHDNLESLCKPCDLIVTAKQFGHTHRPRTRIGADGWPVA